MTKASERTPTAKLFMHGRSPAVYLPKEFRFEGTEVRVSRVGDKVILKPMERPPFDYVAWRAKLDALGARDFLPYGLPDSVAAEIVKSLETDFERSCGVATELGAR